MAGTEERGDVVHLTAAPEPGDDGDDIVVIPDEITEGQSRRRSVWLVTAAGVAVIAIAVWALGFRDDGSAATTRTNVVAPVINPAPTQPAAKLKAKAATPTTVAAAPTTAASVNRRKATNPDQAVASPPAVAPPVSAPQPVAPGHDPALPATYPMSVLRWSGPTALTIAAGGKQNITVAAHNPSKGVVNLPHPLSCAPTLQHDEVCPEMVQRIAPGATARASFVVDATNVAPGSYTLSIEGARTITVTVTNG